MQRLRPTVTLAGAVCANVHKVCICCLTRCSAGKLRAMLSCSISPENKHKQTVYFITSSRYYFVYFSPIITPLGLQNYRAPRGHTQTNRP